MKGSNDFDYTWVKNYLVVFFMVIKRKNTKLRILVILGSNFKDKN